MIPDDPDVSAASTVPQETAPERAPVGVEHVPIHHAIHRGRLLTFAIAAAVLAGAAALVAGEKLLDAYHNDLFPPIKFNPTVEEMSRLKAARLTTATLTFTCLGGFLGLAMGLAGGLARRSVPAGIRAAIVGFVLGAAVEALLAYLVVAMFFKRYDPLAGDLTLPLLTHGAIWLAVGSIGGLARARAWRPGPMEVNSGGRVAWCGHCDRCLRGRRGNGFRVEQDGTAGLSVGHDPSGRPAAGRDLLGRRRGMGFKFSRAGEGIKVSTLLRPDRFGPKRMMRAAAGL